MRRAAVRAAELGIVPTIALVVAVVVAPGRAELAVHAWLLVVLALALVALVRAVREAIPAGPSLLLAARARPPAGERFPSLEKLERAVSMAPTSAYDVHHRLRPVLREIAGGLLLVRRGIDLDRQPELARNVLGEAAWELVQAERERPRARRERGLEHDEIAQIVLALERI